MKKKYLVLLAVLLLIALLGCGKKRRYVAPPPSPFAPFDLIATAISAEQIDLAWKDNSTNEEAFYVYKKNASSYYRIAVLYPNATSYSDSSLKPETTYWYKVTAYSNGEESNPSNEASATTLTEVEILDYDMEIGPGEYSKWKTKIVGEVRNNTSQILTIRIAGEFYSYDDKWIAGRHCWLYDVNAGRKRRFVISHRGDTEIKYVKAWIVEYY